MSCKASLSVEDTSYVCLSVPPEQNSSSTEPTPDDWDEEFIEYAEKCAALADFADLDFVGDDSDIDLPPDVPRQTSRDVCPTSEMDVA